MSQKELFYYEDAIMHEDYTIKILIGIVNELKDSELISFMNDEIKHHEMIKKRLINQMEEICHEWSSSNGKLFTNT